MSVFFLCAFILFLVLLWPLKKHSLYFSLYLSGGSLGALLFYLLLGSPNLTLISPAKDPLLKDLMQKLALHLKENPNDREGWIVLAKTLKNLKQYEKSAFAYQQALLLVSDDLSQKPLKEALKVAYKEMVKREKEPPL